MGLLAIVLSPVVWVMESVLEFYIRLSLSTGASILLLSFTFSLILLPLQRMAGRLEQRIGDKIKIVGEEVRALSGRLEGERLFLATEQIYDRHDYHPIHSVGMGASFFVMLPVLISAILLFTSSEILTGKSFLFVNDLSKPDSLIGPINVLPLVMFAITIVDAKLRFKNDRRSQYRFLFISVVLLVIVYNLASGLVLYWIGSNITSLITSQIRSRI